MRTYEIALSGGGSPNYELTLVPGTLTVEQRDIAGAVVELVQSAFIYDGEPKEPGVRTVGGIELAEGDYDVEYSGNVDAGEATVTVTGKGNCRGTATGTFAIAPKPVTVTAGNVSKVYGDGDPELTTDVEGLVGVDSVEYSVVRDPGEDAGSYAVTPAGERRQGNYEVSYVPGTLTVTARSISGAELALSKTSYSYSGSVQKPAVKTVGGKELKEKTDYVVAYSNASSKNAGSYTVQVTGKGNYTGKSAKATYKILYSNPVKVSAKNPTVKLAKVKKAKQTIAAKNAFKVTGNKGGSVTYKKVAGDKVLAVASNGKVTVARGAKKGAHKVTVSASFKAKGIYAAATKTVTLKVTVK